jgi:integrase
MSARHSTSSTRVVKPVRPAGSPLFWHVTGRWCKKIRGKFAYFGRGSHDDAIAEYERTKDDLQANRRPRDEEPGELNVYQLCAKFLIAKREQRDGGELSARMFAEYGAVCKRLIKVLGKARPVSDLGPDDFATLRRRMAKTWGPVRLKAEIIRSRTPFLWASKSGLIARPPVYGEAFKVPSARVIRKKRAEQGPKLFEADEIRRMIDAAGQPLRTMILFGLNCGFGNGDIAGLPTKSLDLGTGWLNYPRPKTGIERRIPLWPETVAAVRDWLGLRPSPADPAHAGLLFVTSKRGSWKDDTGRALSHETRKLLDRVGIKGHRSFYALRHTFQTVGDECGDFIAVRKIMGHASNDIGDVYRERVSDDRLRKATEHVRGWLFAGQQPAD